jgi:putative transposase
MSVEEAGWAKTRTQRCVWQIPKYRKHILSGEVSEYLKEVFQRIAEEYEFMIDTMEVVEDHVHIFV